MTGEKGTKPIKQQTVPNWLSGHLDEPGLARVADAIGKAELRTTGEIVPMIVRGSSPVGHAPFVVFLILASTFLLLAPAVAPALASLFNTAFGFEPPLMATEGLGLLLAVVIAPVACRFDFVLRRLVPALDRVANVDRRAQLEFYLSRVNETNAHTGVLLFVSLLERRAVVLADSAVAQLAPAGAWDDVVAVLLAGIRGGDFSLGFAKAVDLTGSHLADHFPAQAHERNELANELVIKD